MRRNLKTVLLAVVVGICIAAWILTRDMHRSAIKRKFSIGMKMQEATARLHRPYYISTNIDSPSPWSYLIRANSDGLVLQFDRYEKLISVQLLTDYK